MFEILPHVDQLEMKQENTTYLLLACLQTVGRNGSYAPVQKCSNLLGVHGLLSNLTKENDRALWTSFSLG